MKHNLVRLIAAMEHREQRRISVAEIARETNISGQTLYNWLNAPDHKLLRVETDTIAKLCDFFDCEIKDLLELAREGDGE